MKIGDDIITALNDNPDNKEYNEPYFTWSGCDNCDNNLGNNVYDCHAHPENNFDNYYEVQLCGDCLCAYWNGDSLYDNCRNALNI